MSCVPEMPQDCPRCGQVLPEHRTTTDGGRECASCRTVVPDPFVVARRAGQ